MKAFILAIALLAATLVGSQTTPTPKVAPRSPVGPTKVTGEPTKTASGLEYWDLKIGTGAVAQTGQHVTVDYTVWLASGKKIDSSVWAQVNPMNSCWAPGRSSRDGTKGLLA
jgi:hypothetical protein